ncbi:rhodanese-related sulfurtransferase [Sphingomonas sp.]|uniref:oxygen-dependent tRNA uridine(34) hydroxylase TrhO n=1 Tax=Sphingomonas sp. TaxID=28214 RepID=UPI0025FB8727|nr:rhodanese-related sulfurtransferase [Sphingomonas sp.]
MIRVAALYRFTPFPDPAALIPAIEARAAALGIKGTLLFATEGMNGTIAGGPGAISEMIETLRALPGCAALDVKFSDATAMPFGKLKVRLKREIVTMGVPGIDPRAAAGRYVPPAEWNALIDDPETLLIDTRNAYEVAIGSFAGAVDPGTATFRDFPAWFRANRDTLMAGKSRVAMFCTGGIRCEKATAFVRGEGVGEVYHLEGGILRYLEEVPANASRFTGECFVFDERVAVGAGLAPGSHAMCRACGHPYPVGQRCACAVDAGEAAA